MTINLKARWLVTSSGAAVLALTTAWNTTPPSVAQEPILPGIDNGNPAASQNQTTESPQESPPADPAPQGAERSIVNQQPEAENAEVQNNVQAEALDAGPIHEAFAEPITESFRPSEQGNLIDRKPPAPVDEIPPAYKPEGDNVEWIPGYWTWFEEKDDFVWVSGVWRALPPGRVWNPGHWSEANGKYFWVSGYWSDVNTHQVEYLPYPPESLEEGPSTAAPSENHFWIPGCWTYRNNNYAWTPGYWHPGQQNWVWIPNHYNNTPRGAVFVRGYWDYPVANRGLAYAPVYWQNGYRARPGYSYTPNRALNTTILLSSLFIDNNRGGYYYGDGFRGRDNFRPWYSAGYRGGAYSPLYGYYSWQYGRDSNQWSNRFDDRNYARRTFDNRNRGQGDFNNTLRSQAPLVAAVEDLRRAFDDDDNQQRREDYRRIRELNDNERNEARNRSQQYNRYRAARANFEAEGRNVPRATLDGENNDPNTQDRRARFEGQEGFQPSIFRRNEVEGNETFMEDARNRYQRYEESRRQFDQRRNQLNGNPNALIQGDLRRGLQNQSPQSNQSQQLRTQQGENPQSDFDRMRRQFAPDMPNRGQMQERSQGVERSRGNARQSAQDLQNRGQQRVQGNSDRGNGNRGRGEGRGNGRNRDR